jgi:predicted DsbA family dithiol-disulfide isomerase
MTTNQPAAESTTLIELELWSDLTCPWSWMSKRRIEAAVAAFERPHDVTLRMRAFELDPDIRPGEGVTVAEHLGRKYGGGPEGGRLMNARVSELAADDELFFNWDTAVRASTFDAHRLCALALSMGGPPLQSAAFERFHSAHFVEGLAIDDHEVLQRLSAEAGLDEHRVGAMLAGVEFTEAVRADEALARRMGVTSVPFALANGYAAVAGARSRDDYLALLRGVATSGV